MKKNRINLALLIFAVTLIHSKSFAQEYNLPLNYYSQLFLEKSYAKDSTLVTGSFKSIPESWLELDSVWAYANDETYYSVAKEKLYYDHLFEINKGELNVVVDLLGKQEIGFEFNDTTAYSDTTTLFHNSRGFLVRGSIGKNFSFESNFMENQVFAATYLKDFIDEREMYPGGGRTKNFNNGGFDFAQSGGYLSYSPTKKINLQFGHGKTFIGNGHRSLLLSDNTNNYPYLRGSFKFWKDKLQYHTTMATLLNFERLPRGDTPESRFKIKNASFHYLEFYPIPKLSVGLFESIIWKRYDDVTGTLPYNYASVNPIIFGHSLIASNDEVNNSLVGVDLKYQVTNNLKAYGQLLLDDGSNGFQLGLRSADLLVPDLYLLVEYNTVDPFAYTSEDRLQNYSNQNQELAHPLGADFQELVLRGTYFHNRRTFLDVQVNLNDRGSDVIDSLGVSVANLGNNIFADRNENVDLSVYSRPRNATLFSSLTFGYMFNPQSNLNAYLRFIYRSRENDGLMDNAHIRVGIRTSIFNNYDDF